MGKGVSHGSSVGIARVRERARARHVDVDFSRDLEASPAEEWRREIDQTLFPGGYFKELIFFHKASKTLILADRIINIELDKVAEPWRTVTKFTGMYHPYGQIFFGMRLPILLQRHKAEAAPASWATMKAAIPAGAIPANVSESDRAMVTAGLAKEVEAVKYTEKS